MPRWMLLRFIQVSILGMMALLLVLSGCDTSSVIKQRPTTPPIIPTATTALPVGWYAASTPTGLRFTDGRGSTGLASSPTDPPEVAGCGMPPLNLNEKAVPKFLYSADAGHTWHVHPIQGASATNSCSIVADSILPQTFVIQIGGDGSPQFLVTRDNGVTWSMSNMPAGLTTSLYGAPGFTKPALVDGHLITTFYQWGRETAFVCMTSGWQVGANCSMRICHSRQSQRDSWALRRSLSILPIQDTCLPPSTKRLAQITIAVSRSMRRAMRAPRGKIYTNGKRP